MYYWTAVAIRTAQILGMHRNSALSNLSPEEQKLWKRIWWTLFTRDRLASTVVGGPMMINLRDTDVPMVTEDDFVELDPSDPDYIPADPQHVLFFINIVRLCEIMGVVLETHYAP